jgi:hypothetical protein
MSGGEKGRKEKQRGQRDGKEESTERYIEKWPSLVNCFGQII